MTRSALRREIPSAFIDFRARLLRLVSDATASDFTREQVAATVEGELAGHIRTLETELNSVLSSAAVKAIGYPLAVGAGMLTGTVIGVPSSALLTMGAAGAIPYIGALSDMSEARENAKGHPFYFLWKAKSQRNEE